MYPLKASAVDVPHCHYCEDCTVLAQSGGVQVLLTVLQSVSKLNSDKAPAEQRKNKHLFRSVALICSRFAQLPIQAREIHDRHNL